MRRPLDCMIAGARTLAGCGDGSENADLDRIGEELIRRATIAAIFGHPIDIMDAVKVEDGIIRVSYNRPDDNSLWINDCRVAGQRIHWAGVDVDGPNTGRDRWRDDPREARIDFLVGDTAVAIIQEFPDGGRIAREYDLPPEFAR